MRTPAAFSSRLAIAPLLLLLAACGHTPVTAPVLSAHVSPVAAAPNPAPSSAVPAPADDSDVKARVAASLARLDAVKTMVGQVEFDETKAPPGNFEHGLAKFTFQHAPFAARVDVITSNRWYADGAVLLWNGGKTVKIKPAELPFALTFAYDNSQVVSARGYRLDQTDIFSMGKVLRAPGAVVHAIGPATVQGENVYLVDLHSPASCPGITREVIGLSQKLSIPTYREMYAGSQLVHKGQGLGLVLDGKVASSQFDI